jgi:hypothetical protein
MTYLTKSRFQVGIECPTKLYYQSNSHKYANLKLEDQFLEALANGGFQVGALARAYHPDGILIAEKSNEAAIEKTNEFLRHENCNLFEAAIRAGDYLVRIDVLIKKGNAIQVIEVKAKSFNPNEDSFIGAKGSISAKWRPYLIDVAFQVMVLKNAFPQFTVSSYLMLADKTKTASVHGLNQRFKITKVDGKVSVRPIKQLAASELGTTLLVKIPVGIEVEKLESEEFEVGGATYTLSSYAAMLSADLNNNQKRFMGIGKHCNKCEFQANNEGLSSGFVECWSKQTGLSSEQLTQPLLFELWRGYLGSKDIITPLLNRQDYLLRDFQEEDFAPKNIKISVGYNATERRVLQIQSSITDIKTPSYNKEFLIDAFNSFKYPLHFIDFETTALAIPMYAGRRPYEQIAFQFSHHQVESDGSITHKDQWLNTAIGEFPNYDFIRALKLALENDQGTIFRYHNHENTILNVIYIQLLESNEIDKYELCDFIRSITHKSEDQHVGARDMVDLYQLVIGGFYHPLMKGSNSIKSVLPAIIESSEFLKSKYSRPCYGTDSIQSLNFKKHTWLLKDMSDNWISPYKTLPPVFEELSSEQLDELCDDNSEELKDGGAAMMTYAKMQFVDMPNDERMFYYNALLKYCELDTLAMVMIYEGWKDYLFS